MSTLRLLMIFFILFRRV